MKTLTATTESVIWILTQRGKISHIEASRTDSTSITACGVALDAYYRKERPITKYHCPKCLKAR